MNKGAKFFVIFFMIVAIATFVFGSIFAFSVIKTVEAENANEQLAEVITVLVAAPLFLVSYAIAVLNDIIGLFISIHLIRNDSKGFGVFNLILSILILIGVGVITAMILL